MHTADSHGPHGQNQPDLEERSTQEPGFETDQDGVTQPEEPKTTTAGAAAKNCIPAQGVFNRLNERGRQEAGGILARRWCDNWRWRWGEVLHGQKSSARPRIAQQTS